MTDSRSEFEKWALSEGHTVDEWPGGEYCDSYLNRDVRVWQAAEASLMARIPINAAKDVIWRLADIREMLMSYGIGGAGEERIYDCDEWSTPTVNLAKAIAVLESHISALTQLLEMRK